jgi:aminopeptidase N
MLRLLFLVLSAAAFAEAPFAFDTTPGRLPKDVRPLHYEIHIEPDVEAAVFSGRVVIEVEARKAVREIVLNSLGLAVKSAKLDGRDISAKADDAAQLLTLTGADVAAGRHSLALEFTGRLSERPQGLFLTRYQLPDGSWRKALVTQMEATDARRMFPCWDEPVFRATFALTAIVPAGHTSLFNMPEISRRELPGDRREVVFGRTPGMASYLVAFASAELESLEDEVAGVKLRILATPGKRAQMRHAMDATKKVLPYFNDYFGVKYPLPKLDQVAFPSVSAGGMENWGCIVYADTALLFDDELGAQSSRERVFDIVAHEIAHQWFGDLVTMAWWDNLWLNEGFASWMATKASDHFHPEWKKWLRAAGGRETAMRLDARSTTHPIQQPVKTESDAMEIFDAITYQKGQAFLRMLETWLGEAKFRDGMRLYFKRHANSNTTTADLWAALEEASGEKVHEMAAAWTVQPGFPLLTGSLSDAAGKEARRFTLRQERFTIHQTAPAPLAWTVPVLVRAVSSEAAELVVLRGEDAAVPAAESAMLINSGSAGYFRANYEGEAWERLKPVLPTLPEADKLAVLHDTWALVQAGRQPFARWLEIATLLRNDASPVVGAHFAEVLGFLDHLARGGDTRGKVRTWAREFLGSRFSRLGWDARPGDDIATVNHRAQLIRLLGWMGDAKIVAEAQRRAEKFFDEPKSLPGDLRGAVLALTGRHASAKTWDRLHALAKATTDTDRKLALYGALAATRDAGLAKRALALALAGELPSKLAARHVGRVSGEGEQPEIAWEFAKQNLDALLALCSANDASEFVAGLFRQFTDAGRAEELETFTRASLPPDTARATAITTDEIRFKAELKVRVLREFEAWVK